MAAEGVRTMSKKVRRKSRSRASDPAPPQTLFGQPTAEDDDQSDGRASIVDVEVSPSTAACQDGAPSRVFCSEAVWPSVSSSTARDVEDVGCAATAIANAAVAAAKRVFQEERSASEARTEACLQGFLVANQATLERMRCETLEHCNRMYENLEGLLKAGRPVPENVPPAHGGFSAADRDGQLPEHADLRSQGGQGFRHVQFLDVAAPTVPCTSNTMDAPTCVQDGGDRGDLRGADHSFVSASEPLKPLLQAPGHSAVDRLSQGSNRSATSGQAGVPSKDRVRLTTTGLLEQRRNHGRRIVRKTQENNDPLWTLQGLAGSPYFVVFSAMLILSNFVYVGVQTDLVLSTYIADGRDVTSNFYVVDALFMLLFGLELAVKFFSQGPTTFFTGPDLQWNVFDMVNVIVTIVDFILTQLGVGVGTFLSLLRLCRLVRILRVLRFGNWPVLRALTTMLHSLRVGFGSFVPAIILLFATLYVFGVAFMQGVMTYLQAEQSPQDNKKLLAEFFPNLSTASWTLIATVLGGYDWIDVGAPVARMGMLYGSMFLFYVLFTSLALLNILTGIFVNCAQQTNRMTREIATEAAIEEEALFQRQLIELFQSADIDPDGQLTLFAFESMFLNPRDAAFLASLGFETSCMEKLFAIADADRSGSLELFEFVDLCTAMRGSMKMLHFRILQEDLSAISDLLTEIKKGLLVGQPLLDRLQESH
eukprot:TRINITY_DN22616_c0_g1_i1.p1 TRINITY_DN22616_c0_g1~~TRINITY_DN22616_c0_g1_i1.p1  ORF type:complete len:707 (-),score=78.33 TRINITY_DN22616_c0_g1_i1:112-2232(-)